MKKSKYKENYFAWQKEIGELGGKANAWKFAPYIKSTDKLVDFGCGGGYLLKNLKATQKKGIEVNSVARKQAEKNGITTYEISSHIPNNWADVVISNHALEHVSHPLAELINLKKILKKNGILVIVVPFERRTKYSPTDRNHHLYTWSELNLANLVKEAGFTIGVVKTHKYGWPPGYRFIYQYLGEEVFRLTSHIWGRLGSEAWEVQVVAQKP